jgi:hypothetical protein
MEEKFKEVVIVINEWSKGRVTKFGAVMEIRRRRRENVLGIGSKKPELTGIGQRVSSKWVITVRERGMRWDAGAVQECSRERKRVR